jgi:hypothetical protein
MRCFPNLRDAETTEDAVMECWRKVWRDGFAPGFSTRGLESLRHALEYDDPRLTQGSTTVPEPVQSMLDWPAEGACVIGFGAWQADGLETVGELEEHFSRSCFEADCRLGEAAGCRWFLNWHDDVSRDVLRDELLPEVERELARRTLDGVPESIWDEDEIWSGPAVVAA